MESQCYLPPGRGDIPSFTPAEAGTRFIQPLEISLGYRYRASRVSVRVSCRNGVSASIFKDVIDILCYECQ